MMLFLCSFLQGVDTMHSLTDGKLLTVKLKETKKSLDGMCQSIAKSVLFESLVDLKGDCIIDFVVFCNCF